MIVSKAADNAYMARLNDGHKMFSRGDHPALGRRLRPIILLLMFISAALMLLSRLDHSMLGDMRWEIASWMTPVFQTAMVPLAPIRDAGRSIGKQVGIQEELEHLRKENQQLASWEWRARQLEGRIANLEAIAKAVPGQKLDFITSRVIADGSGAFVHNVIIDAGSENKVKSGYPVVNGDGVVGRIIEIGPHSARVLLATDVSSRIPVVVGPNAVRAILAGDNSAEPNLVYVSEGAKVSPGDEVSTSGSGGLFPSGLRLGVVTGDKGQPFAVKLRANLDRLDYVSVLFYDDPSSGLADDLVSRKPEPGAGTASASGVRRSGP
jgi:rod shape-determining protein MreC